MPSLDLNNAPPIVRRALQLLGNPTRAQLKTAITNMTKANMTDAQLRALWMLALAALTMDDEPPLQSDL